MRAISLWEPWASAMALGIKKNETRSWPTAYRGPLLICAAARKMTRDDLETYEILVKPSPDHEPQYGKALCLVDLYEIVPTSAFHHAGTGMKIGQREASLGDYTPGRYAWLTQNCRPLKTPFPIRGRQGLWIPTAEEVATVMLEIAEAPIV